MRIRIVGPLVLLVCVSSLPAVAAPCDQLAALALKDAAVTSARLVAAGEFVPPTATKAMPPTECIQEPSSVLPRRARR
jgi:hypothetical protein